MNVQETRNKVKLGGVFEFRCFDKNGKLKWVDKAENLVILAGQRLPLTAKQRVKHLAGRVLASLLIMMRARHRFQSTRTPRQSAAHFLQTQALKAEQAVLYCALLHLPAAINRRIAAIRWKLNTRSPLRTMALNGEA